MAQEDDAYADTDSDDCLELKELTLGKRMFL
jgi:hypothetical protein